jgi:hypothetical protein
MYKKQLLLRALPFTLLPITVYSVVGSPNPLFDILSTINITALWWAISLFILFLFCLSAKKLSDKKERALLITVQFYLLWNVFSITRGMFIAENYWDWKGLIINSMALLLPIVSYIGCNPAMVQAMLKSYLKYALPLLLVLAFLISDVAFGYYLAPISFLALLLPAINLRWKLIILALIVFIITIYTDSRSNVLKFSIPVFFSLIYYLRSFLSTKVLELARNLLFIAPILLFCLAATDVFNIFKINEYIEGDYIVTVQDLETGGQVESDLKADTRTFLYVEVLESAQKFNSWLIGRSPARGNESASFGSEDMSERGERLANEAAILNIFTWTGIVGVILHFIVFYKATYLAINRSNNIYLKILGLYIAFRWLYAWVEDFTNFSITFFLLWLMIGMCFSRSFRAMSNKEFESWVRGIFVKRLSAK